MRWIVRYQKGSFALTENFASQKETTRRTMDLARDDSVWSIEVQDSLTGLSRLVTLGSGPVPVRDERLSAGIRRG